MKIKFPRKIPLVSILGLLAGGLVGFGIYKFIGCRTGACPITANPYISVAYGSLVGLLLSFSK